MQDSRLNVHWHEIFDKNSWNSNQTVIHVTHVAVNERHHMTTGNWVNIGSGNSVTCRRIHDDIIKWKHFPCYWTFVRGIHRFPVNSPHKDQWSGALMFSLIFPWINGWVNNREACDLRRVHYDVTVMQSDATQVQLLSCTTYVEL